MVTLPVTWNGLPQEFVAGASYQKFKSTSAYNASTYGQNGFVQNIYAPQASQPKPVISLDAPGRAQQTQSALFGQARLRATSALTLLAGARLSWVKNQDLDDPASDREENARVVPYAGAVFDLTREWSLYGSYSSIFNPQSDKNFEGAFLAPRKGNQVEFGVKGEHLDRRVTSSLSVYRIEDVNRAITDPDPAHPNAAIAAGKVRSQGGEAELTGRLTPEWNLTAGYGYNTTKQVVASPDTEGKPFTTTFPRHTFSLWSDYRLAAVPGLSLGGGVKVRSSIYSIDGGMRWGQGGYSVWSVQAGYDLSTKLKASLTVNNLFDRTYFDRPDGWTRQSYFGEPRNVMLTLAYKM
ncbi:hypothetical protein MASR2M32_31470 [Sphaerotilus sulfidivorans]